MVPRPKRVYDPTPYQRVRKDDQIVAVLPEEWRTYKVCPDASFVYGSTYTNKPALNGTTKVMSDYVVPRFKTRQAAGERFFNNMFREEITVSTTGTPLRQRSVFDTCSPPAGRKIDLESRKAPITLAWLPTELPDVKGRSFPIISTLLTDAEILRLQQEVSTEVWSKIGTSESEIWEGLAEYHKTLAMFNDPLGKLKSLQTRILSAAERSRTSRALLKEVSDGYLMKRYGIDSLVRDIKTIADSLDKASGKTEVKSRAKSQIFANSTVSGSTTVPSYMSCVWSNQISDAVTVRGMSLDEGHISYANNLGLTTKGFLLLPLQLTAYSFVADWFVNLSSYVSATLPTLGWIAKGTALVTTRVCANGYTLGAFTNLRSATYTILEAPTGTCGIVRVTTTRQPLLPPAFVVKSDFKFDKFTRVADAIALVAARFSGINRLVGGPQRRLAFPDKQERAYRNWADTLNYSHN